jgi:predicted nucleotide-binding protein
MFYTDSPEYVFEEAFQNGLASAEGFLKSRIAEIKEDLGEKSTSFSNNGRQKSTRKVFVVHGHDHGSKETVARFLSQLELEPVILHEQADQGRTIIEKFEHHADVACAVVILSPDDVVLSQNGGDLKEQRARQNVIFEMGFFIGRLGRTHTFALLQSGVTKPSDIDGVLYIPMDDESWRLKLVKELKAAGMDVDANKAFS